jgi:general stress protein 26
MCVYFVDSDDFMGLMLGGTAEIIDDMEIKKKIWLDWWTRYYSKGLEDPDYTLLRMEPTHVRFYYKLNQVNFEL